MADNPKVLTHKEILNILPHRYPFLLVDKVLEIKKSGHPQGIGDEITAQKNVTFNEPFFQGHFPEMPIMPGVLLIEAMAQTSGLLTHRPHPEGKKWNFFILGIDGARFRKPVVPGDVLEIKGKCLKIKGSFVTYECKIYAQGELKAEAEIFAQMV